jgi:hypothetical protein
MESIMLQAPGSLVIYIIVVFLDVTNSDDEGYVSNIKVDNLNINRISYIIQNSLCVS